MVKIKERATKLYKADNIYYELWQAIRTAVLSDHEDWNPREFADMEEENDDLIEDIIPPAITEEKIVSNPLDSRKELKEAPARRSGRKTHEYCLEVSSNILRRTT